jgi:hypothetical protein
LADLVEDKFESDHLRMHQKKQKSVPVAKS